MGKWNPEKEDTLSLGRYLAMRIASIFRRIRAWFHR